MRKLFLPLVATLVFAACQTMPPGATTAGTVTATNSGGSQADNQHFVWGMPSIWANLDPTAVNVQRCYDLYETLTTADPTGKTIEPLLATSWTSVDPLTWEFKIRPGSKFHNGDPVTAEDVKWTFEHYADPTLKSPIAPRIPLFSEARAVDAMTVRLLTKQPDPVFLRALFDVPILPKAYYERVGRDDFRAKPVGSGFFKVKQYIPDDRLVLEPFAEHPTHKPTFTGVTIRAIPESSQRLAGLRAGELDFVSDVAPDAAEILVRENFEVVSTRTGNIFGFWTDTVIEGSPTRDKRVRLALNYAIDRETIVKTIFRDFQSVVHGQVASPETYGFNPALKPYPYDKAKARQLLTEAGYPNGFKTQLSARPTTLALTSLMQFVQANLKEVGIDVEIITLPPGSAVLDRFVGTVPREPLFFIEISSRPAFDASFPLTWFQSSNPGANGSGTKHYDNPEFDRVYKASVTELDAKRREELLQQALAILHDDPPYLAIFDNNILTANKLEIKGVIHRVTDIPQLHRAYRAK